jgi:hypothetical protein
MIAMLSTSPRAQYQKNTISEHRQKFRIKKFFIRIPLALLCGIASIDALQVTYAQSTVPVEEMDAAILDADPTWAAQKDARQFKIEIADQVSDGCWVSLSETETVVELELNRSGFEVVSEDTPFVPTVVLNALGYDDGTGCAVYTEFTVSSLDSSDFGRGGRKITALFFSEFYTTGKLLTGPKNSMSNRIKDAFQSHAQEFLVAMNKAVRDIEKKVLDEVDGEAKRHWKEYFESIK